MGMVRRAWARFKRRAHQRGVRRSVARLRRHLGALAGPGIPMTTFVIEMDRDLSKIESRGTGSPAERTIWV